MSENLILPPLLFSNVFPGYRGLQYIQYFFVFPVITLFFTCKKSTFSRPGLQINSHANFTYSFPQLKIILRNNCQNVITKLDYQFMDLTDKGLFLMSEKNPVKLDLLFRVSSLKTKNVFLTVTKLITFFGITPILFLLSECHH